VPRSVQHPDDAIPQFQLGLVFYKKIRLDFYAGVLQQFIIMSVETKCAAEACLQFRQGHQVGPVRVADEQVFESQIGLGQGPADFTICS